MEIVPVFRRFLVRAVAAGHLALSVFLHAKGQNTDNCLLKLRVFSGRKLLSKRVLRSWNFWWKEKFGWGSLASA